MAMIAITTSSSMRVKGRVVFSLLLHFAFKKSGILARRADVPAHPLAIPAALWTAVLGIAQILFDNCILLTPFFCGISRIN
jgi:hypothetical protein